MSVDYQNSFTVITRKLKYVGLLIANMLHLMYVTTHLTKLEN